MTRDTGQEKRKSETATGPFPPPVALLPKLAIWFLPRLTPSLLAGQRILRPPYWRCVCLALATADWSGRMLPWAWRASSGLSAPFPFPAFSLPSLFPLTQPLPHTPTTLSFFSSPFISPFQLFHLRLHLRHHHLPQRVYLSLVYTLIYPSDAPPSRLSCVPFALHRGESFAIIR